MKGSGGSRPARHEQKDKKGKETWQIARTADTQVTAFLRGTINTLLGLVLIVAAVFLLGVLWRRTTAAAATFVLIFAFPYTVLVEYYLFKRVPWLMQFDNWLNRTFVVWFTSMILLVLVSLVTRPPAAERLQGIIWSWRVARLPASERERNRGFRNLFFWWAVFILVMAALYGYVIWFQYFGAAAVGNGGTGGVK